jgi:hypothetical protein
MESEALTAEFRAELKSEIEALEQAAYERGKADGSTAERERIKSVEAQAVPGHEALIAELKFDGKTTGPEAAVKVLAAEKEKRAKTLADLRADAPAPVPHAEAPAPADAPEEQQAAATVEQARKAGLVR